MTFEEKKKGGGECEAALLIFLDASLESSFGISVTHWSGFRCTKLRALLIVTSMHYVSAAVLS